MKVAIGILLLLFISCSEIATKKRNLVENDIPEVSKMAGVSLEMPPDSIPPRSMQPIQNLGANWVAMIPYSIIDEGNSKVEYYDQGMWWGESLSGTAEMIRMAKRSGLKTMMKPHVWVIGQGWPGKFDLKTEKEWLEWESTYREFILTFAKLAADEKVDLFCVGTEFRIAVVKRPDFWRQLIREVRKVYSGKITYASNWDNYEKVTFWDQLDYIGTDAYFPFSKKKDPELGDLMEGWGREGDKLKAFSEKWNKKIIFTEYGFRSIDYPEALAGKDESKLSPNMKNQESAYRAFFQTVWKEDWFEGGFFWKWQFRSKIGGTKDTDFTPQNKPAEKLIQKYYQNAN